MGQQAHHSETTLLFNDRATVIISCFIHFFCVCVCVPRQLRKFAVLFLKHNLEASDMKLTLAWRKI